MSWQGNTRSNYVAIKDVPAFKAWASLWSDAEIIERDGKFGFISLTEDGELPYDREDSDDEDVDFVGEFVEHLADGEILLVMQAGADKARMVSGFATAIHADGREVTIRLTDIYAQAAAVFGRAPSPCEY